MSIVVRFNPRSLTSELYEESVRRLSESGMFPPDGLELHVCFGEEGSMLVSEIWRSREQFDAFRARLMPVLDEVGIAAGEPALFDVHNLVIP